MIETQVWERWISSLKNLNNQQLEKLNSIFYFLKNNYPKLDLEIKWKQPMFISKGTFILSFSVAKNHISFAPEKEVINQFKDRFSENGYEYLSNIFKIKNDQEIDFNLLKEIIDFNINTKRGHKKFFR